MHVHTDLRKEFNSRPERDAWFESITPELERIEVTMISMDVVRQKPSKRDVESPRLFGASHDVELAPENIDFLLENVAHARG
jgi:hypothetical protein